MKAEIVERYRESLEQIWDWQDRELELVLASYELQPQHYLILRRVVESGQADRSDLAARSMRTQGTVTRAIAALESKHLVQTGREGSDKRRISVSPTMQGTAVCQKIEKARSELVSSVVQKIPPKLRTELANALATLSNFVPGGRFESLVPPQGSAGNKLSLVMPDKIEE